MNKEPNEKSFLKDVSEHVMTVLRDDGLYRHLRLARPGTNCMRFDLVTWPGYLAYSGDMGCYVFSRIPDMFEFFREHARDVHKDGLPINLGYWAEKCEAQSKHDGIKEYSADKFRAHIERWLDEREASAEVREAVADEVLPEADDGMHAAYTAALRFNEHGFRFADFWEVDSTEYTYRYVWCCMALVWGIRQFDAAHSAHSAAADAGSACMHEWSHSSMGPRRCKHCGAKHSSDSATSP